MHQLLKALAGGAIVALIFATFDPKERGLALHVFRTVFFAGWIYILVRHAERRRRGADSVVLQPESTYSPPAIASVHDPRKASNALHVVAGVVMREGRILIARRALHKAMAGKWEFPGGKVEAGETSAAALARELREEFGVNVEVGEKLGDQVHEYPGQAIWLEAYWARFGEGDLRLDSHDEIDWVTPAQCRTFDLADADWFIVDLLEKRPSAFH